MYIRQRADGTMKLYHVAKRFRVDEPRKFRLSRHDPAECYGLAVDKHEAQIMLAEGIERLTELQQRLYAEDRWSVLIVLQGMDAGGKDSVIKHVMSGPQSARGRGAFLQATERGGVAARLSLARRATSADQRPHRNLQPLALRGSADGAHPQGTARCAKIAKTGRRQKHLEKAGSTIFATSSGISFATAR